MINVRRWYVYLVSAVALHGVTWATIGLLRNLIISSSDLQLMVLALQISVLLVGLPIFLIHWLWAQRLTAREIEERESFARRLYLYVMMAAFLAPLINNAYALLRSLLSLAFSARTPSLNLPNAVIYNLVPLIVLALLWFYHWKVKTSDDQIVKESDGSVVVRQLFTYLFCGTGLIMSTLAIVNILNWLLGQASPGGLQVTESGIFLSSQIARIVVGLALWVIFWRQAQTQFYGPDERERESVVRKVYLYLVVFSGVIIVTITIAVVLADLFERLLDVPSAGDGGDITLPISIIVGVGMAWGYHAYVLRKDAELAGDAGERALIRRIYLYLMAGVGLTAVLVGLSGLLSVLIRLLESEEQLAWFSATLLAGLPVWLVHWRWAELAAAPMTEAGMEERRSFVRRFYLYFFLFIATMTILGAAIYLVSQVVGLAIGARTALGLGTDISQAIAYLLVAVVVWLYHGALLRRDGLILRKEEVESEKPLTVVVFETTESYLDQKLSHEISDKVPGSSVHLISMKAETAQKPDDESEAEDTYEIISNADVIVAPWSMIAAEGAADTEISPLTQSVISSSANKLLIPIKVEGWEWIGVKRWNPDNIVKDVVNAVNQVARGKELKPVRRLSTAAIVVIVLVSLCILTQLVPIILVGFGGLSF